MAEIEETMKKVDNINERKQISRKSQKKSRKDDENDFGMADYKEFLKGRKLDFIGDLIVGAEESAKALLEEEERRRIEQEEAEELKKEEERRKERQESLRYRKGTWNAKIVDYIAEMGEMHEIELPLETTLEQLHTSRKSLEVPQSHILTNDIVPQARRLTNDKVGQSRRSTTTNFSYIQQRFEVIWKNLKMPLDQRLDMAIKLGASRDSTTSSVLIY
jgi:hypothetical protein